MLASIEKSPDEQVVHLQSLIRDLLLRVEQERDKQCVTLLRPEPVNMLDGISGALSGEAPKPVLMNAPCAIVRDLHFPDSLQSINEPQEVCGSGPTGRIPEPGESAVIVDSWRDQAIESLPLCFGQRAAQGLECHRFGERQRIDNNTFDSAQSRQNDLARPHFIEQA